MKNPKRARKVLFISLLVLISVLVILQTANIVWNTTNPSRTCVSCHEIRNSYEQWTVSAHRGFDCKTCHGTALSNGVHSMKEKAFMLTRHYKGSPVTDIRMNEKQIEKMVALCAGCHQNEFAKWMAGGHSMRYGDVFLNKDQNRKEPVNEQCLHCHGMFYEGSVTALVSPIDTTGPWKIIPPDYKSRSAIPCLACHSIHSPGQISSAPDYAHPDKKAFKQPLAYPKAGFYDPYEKTFIRADNLPALQVWQKDRKIFVSEDPLARICSQCHSPEASHQAGTSDDKTPMGVHEGLSCLSCHQPHSNDASRSCRNCHPAFSNCKQDVEKMNTTFAHSDSKNDIHTVSCTDCHPGSIRSPLKKQSMN
jgi:hypothetical protein